MNAAGTSPTLFSAMEKTVSDAYKVGPAGVSLTIVGKSPNIGES
jgi:hypothetical protein